VIKRTARIKIWPILLALLLIAGAAAAYLLTRTTQTTTQTQITYKTSTIALNSLTQSATGTGTIIASQTANVGFSTSGNIAEIDVQLGNKVKAGQILAKLDSTPNLEQSVANAQLALLIAQDTLENLKTNANAAIATALANQAAAQSALAQAQKDLRDPHDSRCTDDTLAMYYQKYLDAVVAARPWQAWLKEASKNGQDVQYYQMNLTPILKAMRTADLNYQYCLSYTPEEIVASKAALQLAQAKFAQAQVNYQSSVANNGIDPLQLAVAEAAVKNAQMQLTEAQKNLAGATLTAPIAGTITALNGEAGAAAPGGTLITISDLSQPQLLVAMDEVDLQSFVVGCKAEVTFTGISDLLTGQVTEVYPQLTSTRDTTSVQGVVGLDKLPATLTLPLGLNAYVDITCNEGLEALTIPLQAIKQSGRTDSYYVYVLDAAGQPEKRPIELGIQTSNLLEVKSGLSAGEKIITNPDNLP
jgi:HlyD family secretion protein